MYIQPRAAWATAFPWAALFAYQLAAALSSFTTPLTVRVHVAQIGLRQGISLERAALIPLHGFRVVLRDAPAIGVHDTQFVLCSGMALLSQRLPLRVCGGQRTAAYTGIRQIL